MATLVGAGHDILDLSGNWLGVILSITRSGTGGVQFNGVVDPAAANPTAAGVTGTPQNNWLYYATNSGSTAFGITVNAGDFLIYDNSTGTWQAVNFSGNMTGGGGGGGTSLPTNMMLYKGNVDASSASSPASPKLGWMFRISTAGTTAFSMALNVGDFVVYDGTAWQKIGGTGGGGSSGTIPPDQGGTGLTSYAIGDMLYANSTTTLATVAGNTSTTKKVLTQVGSGTVAQGPSWGTINIGDIIGGVSLNSPTFTGSPAAPTPSAGDNSTRIATTGFVHNALLDYAPIHSPIFTGNPQAPTPSASDSSNALATTAFVQGAMPNLTLYALLDSPVFIGSPAAPTASIGDNSSAIATTSYVLSAVAAGVSGSTGTPLWAPINSPMFTGSPAAPTPSASDSSNFIATTEFVQNALSASGVGAGGNWAPLDSPVFTGNPTAPTPSVSDNSLTIPTTAFVQGAIAAQLATGSLQGMVYRGTVDASKATPAAAGVAGTPLAGWLYRVIVAGSTAFGGQVNVGDYLLYDGTFWQTIKGSDPISSTTLTVGTSTAGATTVELPTLSLTTTGSFIKLDVDTYGRVTGTTPVTVSDINALLSSGLSASAPSITVDTINFGTKGSVTVVDTTVNGITPTPILSLPINNCRSANLYIQATQGYNFLIVQSLIAHNGTIGYITQYSDINIGSILSSPLAVTINGGNLQVIATLSTGSPATFRIYVTTLYL